MKLRLFRSLLTTNTNRKNPLIVRQHTPKKHKYQQQEQCFESRLKALAAKTERQYDGAVVSLEQLEDTPSARALCVDHSFRLICVLEPKSSNEVGDLLDRLDSQLRNNTNSLCASSSQRANGSAEEPPSTCPPFIDLVVIRAPAKQPPPTVVSSPTSAMGEILDYLGEVLPLAARFLEENPNVASNHGKTNAQNKPLDPHVIGICHELPPSHFDIADLAEVLDVFSPTRLALSASNLVSTRTGSSSSNSSSSLGNDHNSCVRADNLFGLSYELEEVVQGTDLLFASPLPPTAVQSDHNKEAKDEKFITTNDNDDTDKFDAASLFGPGTLFGEVWCAQQLDGASETYVAYDEFQDEEEDMMAMRLRAVFEESRHWRNNADTRRTEEMEAAIKRRAASVGYGNGLFDPEVLEAAASFGMADLLLPTPSSDIDDHNSSDGAVLKLTREAVKKRWRELALENHPDVSGGDSSGDTFVTLRGHFRTLLKVASREKKN